MALFVALQFTVVPKAANEPDVAALEANPRSVSETLVQVIVPASVPVTRLYPAGTRMPELPTKNLIGSPENEVGEKDEFPQAALENPGFEYVSKTMGPVTLTRPPLRTLYSELVEAVPVKVSELSEPGATLYVKVVSVPL